MAKKKEVNESFIEQLAQQQENIDEEIIETVNKVIDGEYICDISSEDIIYLKQLMSQQEELLISIGNFEVKKNNLINIFNEKSNEQFAFEKQINVKYGLSNDGKFEIDFEKKKIFRKK